MKLGYRDIEGFVRAPYDTVRVIVVYGPDHGLVRERADIMGKTVVPDLTDPFQVAQLTAEHIKDDPAILQDEANAISMMGGRRLVQIKDGADALSEAVKAYLDDPNDNAVIIIECSNLSPKSSLRKLAEKGKTIAAVPCYVDSEQDVAGLIGATLRDHNIRADRDAVQILASRITGDRMRVQSEIEKIVLYKHGDPEPLSASDIRACIGGGGELSFSDLTNKVASKDRAGAIDSLQRLLADGENIVGILRSLENHFKRLHLTRAYMCEGDSLDQAMNKLYPKIFFKEAPAFKKQINGWPLPAITQVINALMDVETQCKKTGYDPDVLGAQAILAISSRR